MGDHLGLQGAFGKVLLVRHRGTGELLAMKVMHKRLLALRDHVAYSRVEREIMAVIDHPYLVGLKFAFQTSDKLYLVMPYMAGGELFAHLNRSGALQEQDAKVYVAEMVLALEHLHSHGIIHRDLKVRHWLHRFVPFGHLWSAFFVSRLSQSGWWSAGVVIVELLQAFVTPLSAPADTPRA